MKLTKLASIAVAGAMAFAVSKASATSSLYIPLVKLNISGSVISTTEATTDSGTVSKGTAPKKVSFNTEKLIGLLNASPTFVAALTNQFHSTSSNSVPKGSYIVWDMYYEELIITNKNGFSFNLDSNLSDDDFGWLDIDEDYLFGDFSVNDTTEAGTENDVTGVEFFFYDYNGNEIELFGTAELKWTYGAVSAGLQKKTLSVKMSGSANTDDDVEVDGSFHSTGEFKASGSGTATDTSFGETFYNWW